MVIIDSDVILIEFAFHRDPRYASNAAFLAAVRGRDPAITVYNLMEILGQLSFNLSSERLADWRLWLAAAYGLSVVWPPTDSLEAAACLRRELYEQPLAHMRAHRMAFMDSLILSLAERTPAVSAVVTWNAKHFEGKTPLPVLTPANYCSTLQ